jgi:hypothetical protein
MVRKKVDQRKCSALDAESGGTNANGPGAAQGSASSAEHKYPKQTAKKNPRRPREDGWTPVARKTFLATLRQTACVRDACRVAAMSSTSAYRLRRRDADFDARWKEAKAHARKGLVAVAHQHAVVGKETVIYRHGVEVERRVTPSDSLLALLIKQGNLTEQDAERLITWEEWQDGVRFDEQGNKIDEREEAAAVRASLDRKLGDMRMKLLARREREEEALQAREARVAELEAKYGGG